MRKISLILVLFLLISSAQAIFGTFASDKQQEGPKAEFKIGVVADEEIIVEIDIEEVEGLNYEYERNRTFDINDPSSQYMYRGENLPVNYYGVNVSDKDPVQGVYEVPVTLRAYRDQGGTGPLVVQEREYSFEYASGFEEEHGFGGDLITPEETRDGNDTEEEETKTSEQVNETERGEEQEEQETVEEGEGFSASTYILVALLLLTVLYIIREALT